MNKRIIINSVVNDETIPILNYYNSINLDNERNDVLYVFLHYFWKPFIFTQNKKVSNSLIIFTLR